MSKQTETTTAEPRRGREYLPPEWSTPPAPIVDAAEELRNAGLAREAARAARNVAEAAVTAAERSDHAAADAAARQGKAAPPAEVSAARAQLDGERRREAAAKRIEHQARLRLGRLLREHGSAWAEAELAALEAEHADTVELLDQAQERAVQLFRRMMLVRELKTSRPGPVQDGRRLRVADRTVESNIGGLFNSARATLGGMLPRRQDAIDAEQREVERRTARRSEARSVRAASLERPAAPFRSPTPTAPRLRGLRRGSRRTPRGRFVRPVRSRPLRRESQPRSRSRPCDRTPGQALGPCRRQG